MMARVVPRKTFRHTHIKQLRQSCNTMLTFRDHVAISFTKLLESVQSEIMGVASKVGGIKFHARFPEFLIPNHSSYDIITSM